MMNGPMRTIACLVIAVALSAQPVLAQEEAAAGGFASGGFGAPVVKFSSMLGEFVTFVGVRGGWVANHSFVIGAGAYTLVNTIDRPDLIEPITKFVYGGFEVEYIGLASEPVHFTILALVGAGRRYLTDEPDPDHDEVFVFEPAVNLQVNVTNFFRVDAGGGYRYVSKETTSDTENSDYRAFFGALTFRFGSF